MILGVTGGIGSGKSTVCHVFKILDVPVYDSDARARILTGSDPDIRKQIIDLFGSDAYVNGQLNRREIAGLVFKSPQLLQSLNSIVHPVVSIDFKLWLKENEKHPLVIKEAAILFESGAYKQVDTVLTVVAPVDIRVQRVMKRDNISENDVFERMKNQWSDEEKIKLSTFVVHCNDKQMIIEQVLEVYKSLMK